MSSPSPSRRIAAAAAGVAIALVFTGCVERPFTPAVAYGERLFSSPAMSTSMFNDFSCATCHAVTEDPPDGFLAPGYSLRNAAFRTSFWGGFEPTLLEAVNFCLVFFMRGQALAPDDPKGKALYEYLASISPERPSPALPLTVAENIVDVPRGDAARGSELYEAACRVCHGEPSSGRGRLNDRVSILEEAFATYDETFPELGGDHGLVVIEKVRHGQFFGIGGNMPLYSKEALSDEDLGALLTFLGM